MRFLIPAIFLTLFVPALAADLIMPAVVERDAPVTVTYRTTPQATGAAKMSLRWTDALGRVVEDRDVSVRLTDETEIQFPLDLTRAVAMRNRLEVRFTLDGTHPNGSADHREETATASFVVRPGDPSWWDYIIMMWQPHTSQQAGALKALGINAGQYSGRRETPPDFLLDNDLRGYAENIATDFYSEYHRYRSDRTQNWSWLQAKELYRRDPSSKEALKRHPSLSDPAWQERIRERLAKAARHLSPYRPVFYDLGDESGIADLASFWDFDFSDQSLAEMRVWLKSRYGTLAALNTQWGTHFDRWEAVVPETTREAMRRTDDNYSSWSDHKEWMDVSYERALSLGVDAVRSVDRDAYVAIAGAQMPGWGGYDYSRLSRTLTAIEPYDIGNNIEILHSLNPQLPFVTTAFATGPWEKHRVWYELLHGARGQIIWDEKHDFLNTDGTPGPRGIETAPYYRELRNGLGALLAQSEPQWDAVAVHYSQPSMRIEWMLAQKPKGDAWVSRTSATERLDSDFLRLRESWTKLVQDEGLQARYVSYDGVERGELLRRGYRVLVLPRSSALSDAEAKAIREFVAHGGRVIADGEPGTFDERCRRRPQGALTGLSVTRMDALSYNQDRLTGKEGTVRQALSKYLEDAGVRPAYAVSDEKDQRAMGVETRVFRNGAVTLVGLISNPELRVDELGPPEFKSNQRFETPRKLRLRLPSEMYVYDVRGGRSLGRLGEVPVALDPYEPAIFALSAEALPEFHGSTPPRVTRGETAHLALRFDRPTPARTAVLHIDVIDPSGNLVLSYSGNMLAGGRGVEKGIPFAVNDAAGKWTIRVRDLLSGRLETAAVELE